MTRKDYVLIARTIAEERATALAMFEIIGATALENFADRLADQLELDNPRFNRAQFIAACKEA